MKRGQRIMFLSAARSHGGLLPYFLPLPPFLGMMTASLSQNSALPEQTTTGESGPRCGVGDIQGSTASRMSRASGTRALFLRLSCALAGLGVIGYLDMVSPTCRQLGLDDRQTRWWNCPPSFTKSPVMVAVLQMVGMDLNRVAPCYADAASEAACCPSGSAGAGSSGTGRRSTTFLATEVDAVTR